MSRLLVAQRALTVPGWAKDALWRRAQAIPSLDLRFADNKSLVDATTGQNLVTFTRASSGTYVDSTGVLRSAAANLLLRSEEFDNAAWAPIGLLAFGSGSTANAIASPNGQITADLLTESTTTGTHQVQQTASVTIGQVYTCSVFCKLGPNAVRRIQLLVTNANFTVTPIATFDLTTGTVVSVVQGTASITSYANGWYRLVLNTIAATSTGVNGFHFRLVDTGTNNSYTGDGSAGLYLWGAQLEQSATVGEYIPTTSTINSAPRFDHNPTTGESLGLLVEEQRTNLLLRSEEFDDAAWTPLSVPAAVTANNAIAPNGTLTADLITGVSAAADQLQQVVTLLNSTVYTYSIYIKQNTTLLTRIGLFNATASAWMGAVDIAWVAGVPSTSSTIGSPSSISYVAANNGWYRCSFTTTTTTASTQIHFHPDRNNTQASAWIWGAQVEQGAFAASYIPTTTAAVTRSADVVSITGSNYTSWANNNEGTVFSDSSIIASQVKTQAVWELSGGTVLSSLRQPHGTANQFRAVIGGTFTGSPGTGATLATGVTRAAVAYSGTAGRLQVESAGANATGSALDATSLSIGSLAGSTQLNGRIKRLCFWPTRLADSTLQQLTQ